MLFAVGKRREYFYRIEMDGLPEATSERESWTSRFINNFFEGLPLNPFRGFTPRPPVSNLGGIHTDATGFGVSPRGVQGRPLVWII